MESFSSTLNGHTFERVASVNALGRNFRMWMVEDSSITDSLSGRAVAFSGGGIHWAGTVNEPDDSKALPVTYVQGMNCRNVLMMDEPGYCRAVFGVRFLRDLRFGAFDDIPTVDVNDFNSPAILPYCAEGSTDEGDLETRRHAFNMLADRMRSKVAENRYKPAMYVMHLVMTCHAMGDFQVLPAPEVYHLNVPGVVPVVAYPDDDSVTKSLTRSVAEQFLGFDGSARAHTLSSGGGKMDRVYLQRR